MMFIGIKIVSSDDWEALYINDIFVNGAHRLAVEEVIEEIKFKIVTTFEKYEIDDDVLENKYGWEFPDYFSQFNEDDLVEID